jgi:ribosome recycling factor
VHNRLEEARVAVRNIRRDGMKDIKEFKNEKLISEDEEKQGEEELQKITDRFIAQIEKIGERKQKEIMKYSNHGR